MEFQEHNFCYRKMEMQGSPGYSDNAETIKKVHYKQVSLYPIIFGIR